MARTKSQLFHERRERERSEWYERHKKHLAGQSFRKLGGTPDSTGKVHDLEKNPKGKALARKINSPKAKEKRALRGDVHEGHGNNFVVRRLAHLNRNFLKPVMRKGKH